MGPEEVISPTSSFRSANKERRYSPIAELRQYTLHPGKRDVLIDLFEKFFIEKQEETGAELIGQFRELRSPDLFVWVRGFSDMEARGIALERFYSSSIWKAHRQEANDTMIDSNNVLLLHESWPGSGFHVGSRGSDPRRSSPKSSLVTATICNFDSKPNDYFLSFFKDAVEPILSRFGSPPIGIFVTEYSPNNFPKLPVREVENVFVWFCHFPSKQAYDDHNQTLQENSEWLKLQSKLLAPLIKPPEILMLAPTLRSKLN
jgi:NIPSNAP